MNLFPAFQGTPSDTIVRAIEMPLGSVHVRVVADGVALTHERSATSLALSGDGSYHEWNASYGAIAQLCSRPTMIREYWEDILDCWAMLWRIDLAQAVEQLTFEATWTPSVPTYEGGSDSGQGLEAQTWNTPTMMLTLGTEGEDDLYARTEANDRLPQRFLDQAPDGYTLPLVHYLARGFASNFAHRNDGVSYFPAYRVQPVC